MSDASPKTYADPYKSAVVDYAQAGWPCILPVPPATKTPPPQGYTGAEGRDTDPMTLVDFATRFPGYSIALRMPETVIGIDVDQYEKGSGENTVQKHGAETFEAHLALWGPLPATWTSTAREPAGASRIYFFRVPAGRYATRLQTEVSGDVEVIQRHHRYAVVWPSHHPNVAGGAGTYTWYDPAGVACEHPPKPEEFPDLPSAWVEGLRAGASAAAAASSDHASGQGLLDQLGDDWRPECAEITSARLVAVDQVSRADAGSRHDTMTERTHHLVQLAASGHTGVAAALLELRTVWDRLTAGEDRAGEFDRMLLTSARKAVTTVGRVQVPRDPCLLVQGFAVPAPAPADGRPDADDAEPVAPARWWRPREVLGVAAFDPNADLDQTLAERVLERTWPAVRYAYDAGKWLRRGPEQWETIEDLAPWAVSQVMPLMPVGDPTAEKGSDQHARSARRARLATSAGARAVASKMRDVTVGGYHPCALRLEELDLDPDLLWAGGLPYDLRACADAPVVAQVDPSTPHLHAAADAPAPVLTPLWDAYLAAVWPDESVRRWALRVLSVAFTGHSARILPILLGDGGRGKTQTVELLMSVLGSYSRRADTRLLKAADKVHASIVYDLRGHRLAFIDEGPPEGRWAQERLKDLTGGGEQTANQMHKDPINFRPTHTLVLTANEEPILVDAAVRARVRLIPCDGDPGAVAAARAAIGNRSGARWRAEAPGVLAKMMAEAAGWLASPETASQVAAPEHIRYLAETIGAEQDPIRVWLEEETEPFELGTSSRELYQAFRLSCQRSGIRGDLIPSETSWGRTLTRLGYPSIHLHMGKRRLLRLRMGGFLPGMGAPAPIETVTGSRIGDGFGDGLEVNPSPVNPQVNPSESVDGDGLTGLVGGNAHTHERTRARTRAREAKPPSAPEPVTDPWANRPETAPDLQEQGPDGLEPDPSPAPGPKQNRERSAAATEKAAAKRAEARQAAIAEAAGGLVELPAVVTRDGAVASISASDASQLLATITSQPDAELTVDVETTGFPVGHQDYALRTVQLGNEALTVVLDPTDPDQADVVRRHLATAPILHAHSATADLVPLEAAGLLERGLEEAWSRMYDTVIPAKLADPASTGADPGLKKLAPIVLGDLAVSPAADRGRAALFKAGKWLTETKVTTPLEKSGWAQVDSRSVTMVRYAAADVLDDAAIARRLPEVSAAILERERLAQRMTARVAFHGLLIDGEHVKAMLPPQRNALEDAAGRLRSYGVENAGSDQQVGATALRLGAQLPRTKTGRPSVAAGVLEPMRGRGSEPANDLEAFVRARLDYQKAETAIGLFLEPYHQLVEHGDGRARPTVYTLSADTGRMSCVRPNLQQVPREGGFRACITADPGTVLVSADFASVELRVAAALSGDTNLRAILDDPARDVHMEIARVAFGPNAGKADRYMAKRKVFGRIYGQGLEGMARTDGAGLEVARAVIDAMDAMVPGLTEWSRMVRGSVEAGSTKFATYAGRVVHLDQQLPHKAPNYCIQGTARELLIDALVRWSQTRWGADQAGVLLPVHDELLVVVPEQDAAEATAALVEVMASSLYGVEIKAEASEPTSSWKDAS